MKNLLTLPPPPFEAPGGTTEMITLTLRTITPMFGGGYEPGMVDIENPIRPASIRGHLRYWWRATAGASCQNAIELFERESDLWGRAAEENKRTERTEGQGKVAIRVQITKPGDPIPFRDLVAAKADSRAGSELGYFLFPFDEQKKERRSSASGVQNVEFTLSIVVNPEHKVEVTNAVRTWIAFGGIGARTRRGCGSLTVREEERSEWLPGSKNWENWFKDLVPQSAATSGWSHLSHGVLYLGSQNSRRVPAYQRRGDRGSDIRGADVLEVWCKLAWFWARFRKGHHTEKRPQYTPRNGGAWQDHETLKNLHPSAEKVELAKPYLGLPLIYQEIDKSFAGTLESESSGRMASPVILKPVAFADGSIRAMVAILNAPAPQSILLKERKQNLSLGIPVDDPVLKSLGVRNPLDAVKAAAHKEQWAEVQL